MTLMMTAATKYTDILLNVANCCYPWEMDDGFKFSDISAWNLCLNCSIFIFLSATTVISVCYISIADTSIHINVEIKISFMI